MKKYTANSVKNFVSKAFGINSMPNSYEVQTTCPKCGHSSFYFNIRKQVGFCHHDVCHYAPVLDDLIQQAGYAPEEFGTREVENIPDAVIEMPPNCVPVFNGNKLNCALAMLYLKNRGIDELTSYRFDMQSDGLRVYVPIRYEGKLVSWLGRDLTGCHPKKYKLCPGSKITNYLFGWEECRQWPYLSLVENTLVSIVYRNLFNCTTNFGSNLSDAQVKLIVNSKVKTVALLWDENTEKACERALRKLHSAGVRAAYAIIKGQPDNYPIEVIKDLASKVHAAALSGTSNVKLCTI